MNLEELKALADEDAAASLARKLLAVMRGGEVTEDLPFALESITREQAQQSLLARHIQLTAVVASLPEAVARADEHKRKELEKYYLVAISEAVALDVGLRVLGIRAPDGLYLGATKELQEETEASNRAQVRKELEDLVQKWSWRSPSPEFVQAAQWALGRLDEVDAEVIGRWRSTEDGLMDDYRTAMNAEAGRES